jgi:membrane associated rhomboid family serine protease
MIPLRDRLPIRTTPFVTYSLIAANVLAFLVLVGSPESVSHRLVSQWGFVPSRFLADPSAQLLSVLTAMFLHGGWLHVGGNMLFLWIFGDNVEDALGHQRYAMFYLFGGFSAALTQMLVDPASTVPMVGASGAIAAILAGYVSLYPRARVLVLLPIFVIITFFEFPAWLVILEWFVLQVFRGFSEFAYEDGAGGVAWFAHIGGFLAGLVLIRLGMIGKTRVEYEPWRGWHFSSPSRRRPRLPFRARGRWDR